MPKDALLANPLEAHRDVPGHDRVPVAVGDVLAGKYRVDSILGVGGMGVVVAATHVHLGQRVAVKFMLPEALKDPAMAERFVREARNAVRLRSEHVAKVLDVGQLQDGTPYMVMELLEGTDLRSVVRAGPSLPINHVVAYVLQACEAVAEAHSLGIVHRDLKPHNLFLTRKTSGHACVKVLDFGISKLVDPAIAGDSSLTRTTAVMGSPHYMAPEQMRSARSVDVRADVWALGVCLYQFLTGHVPFEAETLLELGGKVLHEPPTPVSHWRSDVSPELDAILQRCFEKDPARRFANAGELAAALEQWLVGSASANWSGPHASLATGASVNTSSGVLTGVQPGHQAGSYSGRTGVAWGEGTGGSPQKRPVVLVAVGTFVGVLLLVSVALIVLSRGRGTTAAATAPPPPVAVSLPSATTTTPPPAATADTPPATPSPDDNALAPAPPSTGAGLGATGAPPPKPPPPAPPPPVAEKADTPPPQATQPATAPKHHDTPKPHTPATPPASGNAFDHL